MHLRFCSLYTVLFGAILFACNPEGQQLQESQIRDLANAQIPVRDSAKDEGETSSRIILFFGNSLTAGYGVELSEAFPALIQQRIDSLVLPYEVRNSGLSGETTASGLSRIEFVLGTLRKPLAVFVLELGANDGLRGIDLTETRENLHKIIEKVRSNHPEARIILCGMEVPPNMGDIYTEEFRSIFPELATLNQTSLIPFLLNGVAGEPELNLPDGIHPTPEGHSIVAQNVWQVLAGVIQEQ